MKLTDVLIGGVVLLAIIVAMLMMPVHQGAEPQIILNPVAAPSGSCTMSATFIDVGQGDATYISFPNGNSLLVDVGPGTAYANSNISRYVPGNLTMFVATHDHADHTGGFEYLESHYIVPQMYDYSNVHVGANIALDIRNTTIKVLNPAVISDDENDRSIVMKITYRNVSFLLDGDASSTIEDKLHPGKSTVLKVAHHGSRTSTSYTYLHEVQPEIAIISVGKNSYGHPSPVMLDRMKNIPTYRTDLNGTIKVCTDGNTAWVV